MSYRAKLTRYCVLLAVAFAFLATPSAATVPSTATWCASLAAGNPSIDNLGDSVGAGTAVADPGQRWPAQLATSLQNDGAPGAQVWIGGAIDGSATADYLPGARYSNHIEFTVNHPDVILMGWWINDWAGGVPVATFQSQYQQIIDRVKFLSPTSTIVLIHTPWVYDATLLATRGDQTLYRNAIRNLATINNLHYLAEEWPYPGDNRYLEDMPDRTHKNANGQNTQFAIVRYFLLGMCT